MAYIGKGAEISKALQCSTLEPYLSTGKTNIKREGNSERLGPWLSALELTKAGMVALYQALQRRALAMDLTGLATFEVSKKWIDRMFAIYSQAPAPGFQKVSQSQLLRADRHSFVRLSENFTGNLKVAPTTGLPLDPLIAKFDTDMSITYFMLPIPVSQSSTGRKARQKAP